MASWRSTVRTCRRDFDKYIVAAFVMFTICLWTWDSVPCPGQGDDLNTVEESPPARLNPIIAHSPPARKSIQKRNKLREELTKHITEIHNREERVAKRKEHVTREEVKVPLVGEDVHNKLLVSDTDLSSHSVAKINVKMYMKLLYQKTKDMESKNLLTKLKKTDLCDMSVSGGPCRDLACRTPIPKPGSEENLRSVLRPLTHLRYNALSKMADVLGPVPKRSKVTFLTASSSNHFLESQALIKNLHEVVFPQITNFTFYFYDLGLKDNEVAQLKKWCRCDIRKYPLTKIPKRFSFLRGFTWKPIIINAHLPYTEYVVWVDASIRFAPSKLTPMLKEAYDRGLVIAPGEKFSIGEYTSLKMFEYFGSTPCQFMQYPQAEASFQVIHNEPFTRDLIIKVWAACALDPLCMCPHQNEKAFHCNTGIRKYGKCDRTDQAAHSLIFAKLFQEYAPSFYIPKGRYHTIRRHHKEDYFNGLEKKNS